MRRQNTAYLQPKIAASCDPFVSDPLTMAENAAWRLAWEQPQFSAHAGASAWQISALCLLVMLIAAGLALAAESAVFALSWVLAGFFFLVLLFRVIQLGAGFTVAWRGARAAEPRSRPDADLPFYSVLIPLYDEPGCAARLIAGLSRLDYPRDRLEIILVLEEDDAATFGALQNMLLPPHFEVQRVPAMAPRTKPKACNYALASAIGEYVVIFDAEDIPDRDQLRKAITAFDAGGAKLACLQARLNYFNPRENWLTRQFTLEYSMWFDWLLPGLQVLGLPIPLGGTSNHFRASVLRDIGGWDSYNVTEDADLGLRLARRGYACAVLDSTTMEEANCQHGNWLRQRTRWQKGYMLTWMVHMRDPVALWRELGPKGFLGFQLFIGGTVALALALPASLLIFLLGVCACGPGIAAALNNLNGVIFTAGLIVISLSAATGAIGRGHYGLLPDIVLTPLYWGLTMLASIRAIWQFARAPFLWEKTRHGLSRITPLA